MKTSLLPARDETLDRPYPVNGRFVAYGYQSEKNENGPFVVEMAGNRREAPRATKEHIRRLGRRAPVLTSASFADMFALSAAANAARVAPAKGTSGDPPPPNARASPPASRASGARTPRPCG